MSKGVDVPLSITDAQVAMFVYVYLDEDGTGTLGVVYVNQGTGRAVRTYYDAFLMKAIGEVDSDLA